jgi:hypothetical protein
MLAERTTLFSDIPREIEAIVDFGQHILESQVDRKPLTEFHHCPYIGFVGRLKRRVGCLLHPQADGNNGIDLRGLSDYGGLACREYFCPAHTGLGREIKQILTQGAERWYEYGILVTEVELINELFRLARQRCRAPIQTEATGHLEQPGKIFEILSSLKARWAFAPKSEPLRCHYFFRDGLYHRTRVVYPVGAAPSRYHVIFQELCSRFETTADLRLAEEGLNDTIQRLAAALAGHGPAV